ncbi:hypothetical protein PR202_gb22396 [Eleusine coracana subsp. coracana]|uniref:PGG domain-containing protein n=1 Tax=Eleusine coracana subsp. coracana TaxID=191504 RepID=A0AAV5FGG9_ELECO|nr:hypothetical protein PR202_gb22396 [Eleusine coracana subsp. coracana]
MDEGLLQIAMSGEYSAGEHIPGVLHGTTQQGNTCLHISSIHGREQFCREVLARDQSLLAAINSNGETPLLTAVTSGHLSLASYFLKICREQKLSAAVLRQDNNGFNALHHAIRSGHEDLALELIIAEPSLSRAENKYGESPMFIAVMRGFTDVVKNLLNTPDSSHAGACGYNALHGAVKRGNTVIEFCTLCLLIVPDVIFFDMAKMIIERRPELAREENDSKHTPMNLAVIWNKVDVLGVLLKHDWSLGYTISTKGAPLLFAAATRGHVAAARELLKRCPDTPSSAANGWTCLHEAVCQGQVEFVQFILRSPQLRNLINMRDAHGKTALHHAVKSCNPNVVAALLVIKDIDLTVLGGNSRAATWELHEALQYAKTIKWNEVYMIMLKADPDDTTSLYNLHLRANERVTNEAKNDVRSLTQTYTSSTSLVAILMATITFAAAFTLPGGYSNDVESQGLPVMARKLAFQAFLISDILAMCSSLAVAFVCVTARWEDLGFLLYYKSFTRKLMWFAYIATITTFTTGLYTVLAPRAPRLAVATCFLPVLLPIATKILGEWPVIKLRLRLGRQTFKSELLDMV